MTEMPATQPRIVVGVDGSPSSKDALRWAELQARRAGAELDAVIAWEYPAFFGWAPVSPDDVGSVSTYCVHHATVPVTVIRPAAPHSHRHPH